MTTLGRGLPEPTTAEDIAIVGMANVFPGSDTPAQFWQNIVDKVDCVTDPPPDWQPECFVDPMGLRTDRCYTGRGGFLADLCRFDAVKHGTMPSSIEGAEPDHFIALRCAEAALADAGFPNVPLKTQSTAVILGRGVFFNRGSLTWMLQGYLVDQVVNVVRQLMPGHDDADYNAVTAELRRNLPPFNAETVAGLTHSVLAGRIANRLNLNGPAYTVDAACASTLVAVEHGLDMLRSKRVDAVIAGGVQVSTPGMVQLAFCHLKAMSRTGRIAPFSADADGTLLGQGCGMLVLKRVGDAERDGNRIYAVIKAVGLSSDGKGTGLLAPRQEGQELAILRAYEQCGVSPDSIGLIEAHATGIPLGDQTEIRTLTRCFGRGANGRATVAIGSVKSMISHLIPASGSAGLMKTALALYHRVLPPTLHAEKINPSLELEKTPFFANTTTRPWIHGGTGPRRAAMNAFGFGGINAHAVLEEYVPRDEAKLTRSERNWPAELVTVFAKDRQSLIERAESFAAWVDAADGVSLLEVAAAANNEWQTASQEPNKQRQRERAAIVATSPEDLSKKLRHLAKLLGEPGRTKVQVRSGIFWFAEPLAQAGRVAWVFPGEGSQYVNMLADLCRHFPEVRRAFDLTDRAFLSRNPPRTLSRLIFPLPNEEATAEEELLKLGGAVTSVTAASRALMALMQSLELRPDAIVGHSSGEFGALMAAGVFPTDDENRLVRDVAAGADSAAEMAASNLVPSGSLTAVGGIERSIVDGVLASSGGRLTIAMDNCPHQLVLVGDDAATQAALAALQGHGGLCQRIAWSRAYHTSAFRPAAQFVEKYYRSVGLRSPNVELWSCATAGRFPSDADAVLELAVRQWYSPVRFQQTISAMYEAGVRVFVEVGPRGNLSAFVSDTLNDRPHAAVALDVPRKSGVDQLCFALAMLVAHGAPVNLRPLYLRREPAVVDLHAASPKKRLAPRLKLELPELRVSEELAKRLTEPRETATDKPTPTDWESSPKAVEPLNNNRAARKAIADNRRAQPVLDFQRTMQQFLEVQKSVVDRVQRLRNPNGVPPTPTHIPTRKNERKPAERIDGDTAAVSELQPLTETPRGSARRIGRTTTPMRTPPKEHGAFIDSALEHVPQQRFVGECELDIAKHAFLLDHTFFGGPLSKHDATLHGLPVLPMAMMLELMAEAALVACPDRMLSAFADVKTMRWVTFEKPTRRIRVDAVVRPDGHVDVTLFEADREGFSAEIIKGIVELSDAPVDLGQSTVPDRAKAPAHWASDLYGRTLYHGRSFAGIRRIETCDEAGVRARISTPEHPIMISGVQPTLATPVALVDTCSQVAGLVYGDWKRTDRHVHNVYPNGFERLELDVSMDWAGEFVAVAQVGRDGRHFRSDFELKDRLGHLAVRMLRRVDEIVDFPTWVYAYFRDPAMVTGSTEITNLFADVPGADALTICRLTHDIEPILLKHPWIQVVAHMILDREERKQFARRSGPPAGNLSWLLGRLVAKDAVRMRVGDSLCLADVQIETESSGRPMARLKSIRSPLVSLSHKDRTAVAVAADAGIVSRIGIDTEPRRALPEEVVRDAFSDEERTVLKQTGEAAAQPMQEWILSAWCAKEALGKALGTGLVGGPTSLEVVSVKPLTGAISLRPRGAMIGAVERATGVDVPVSGLTAWARIEGDNVLALCVLGLNGPAAV